MGHPRIKWGPEDRPLGIEKRESPKIEIEPEDIDSYLDLDEIYITALETYKEYAREIRELREKQKPKKHKLEMIPLIGILKNDT